MIKHDTTAIVVEKEGKILLIKRSKEPRKGFWEFPGGHVDPGETVAEAAQREASEEVGPVEVEKEPFEVLDPEEIWVGHQHKCHYFKGRAVGGVRAGDDAAEAEWFTPEEMGKMSISYFTLHILNRMYPDANAKDR